MPRRSPLLFVLSLGLLAALTVSLVFASGSPAVATVATVPAPTPIVPASIEAPVGSANAFLPEGDMNVTDCVGLLQRPGCGSEDRGGWRTTLIFIAVCVALIGIGIRIAFGLRKRKQDMDTKPSSDYF